MAGDELDYYEMRAEQEIEAARQSTSPEAVRAHYLLAGFYLDLVHNPDAAAASGMRQLAAVAGPEGGARAAS